MDKAASRIRLLLFFISCPFAFQKDYIYSANGVQLQFKWSTVGVQKWSFCRKMKHFYVRVFY